MLFKRKAKRLSAERKSIPKPEVIIQKGFGNEMPPQRSLVDIYFNQKNQPQQGPLFYEHYTDANWCSPKGTPYRNWKLLAGEWIFNFEEQQKLRRRLRENLVAEL